MKRIAIIIDGDLTNRKGQVNASLSRIKHLKSIADYQIDVYAIQHYDSLLVRLLRKTNKRERLSLMQIDGMDVNLLWNKFSLMNYLLVYKFKYKPLFRDKWNRKQARLFQSYDLISVHSIACARLALAVYKQFRIPYYVTWHGSDIHTLPYANKYNWEDTVQALENAEENFFVSKALLSVSEKITPKAKRQLLYNGVGDSFMTFSPERRESLKKSFHVEGKKVVAFIGNLFPIKNVLLLPEIFKKVAECYAGDVVFWTIGDGKLRSSLQRRLQECGIDCTLWGNQPVEKMPEFMNAIDVLVLPSKNEGLPLVTVEALACGANVVGSNVGGIAEVIGSDNVFDLDEDFVTEISGRIVQMLESKIKQPLLDVFNWNNTARIENEIYSRVLDR